jgi:PKD repeat protein
MRAHLLLTATSFLLCGTAFGQQWMDRMHEPEANFYDVQDAFNQYWQGRSVERGKGFKVFKRWEAFMEERVYPTGTRPDPGIYQRAVKELAAMERLQGTKSNANWQPLGPYSWANVGSGYNPGNGRVNCITVDPTNANIVYVGTPAGGLWKSIDAGQTWNALFTDQPTLGVSGIAVDHTNGQVIYCATGDGDGADTYSMGVLKSIDGGTTWNPTGLNWQTTATRTTRMLRMHPTDPLILFCATSNGLWKTEDGGGVWANVADGSFHDVEMKPDDPGIVYACGDQFFRSLDGGSTFSPITSGLPAASEVNRMRIAVSPNDAFNVYVLCGSGIDGGFLGLYRSTDGGSSFSLRSSSPNVFGYDDAGGDSGGQSNYDMALAVDPANANTVWVGGVNVWKSTNGGANWTIQSHWFYAGTQPYTHADIHSLDVYNGNVWCATDGGAFRSTNGGTDWVDRSIGLQITQFYRLGGSEADPGSIIAGAQDNGMNLLADGDWAHVLGADGMEGAIDPSDPNILYGEFQNGGISRSDDGGQNFFNIAPSTTETGGWVTPFAIDQQQPNVLIAGYNNLWRSDDRGNNWQQWSAFPTNRTVRAIAIAPSNSNVVYFCNTAWMRRTLNNGGSWELASTGLPDNAISSIAVDPNDPQHLFVALSGYTAGNKVFESSDAGDSWTNISANLPNVPANTLVFQNGTDDGLYVGTDIGVFYTDNTLSNWQPFAQGLPKVIVNELEINYASSKLRAATFGRGLWETDLFLTVNAPPSASFTWEADRLCVGDAVQFSDASVGAAPGWSWSFPGGTPATSTLADPQITYATPGTYTATLTVSNGFGTDDHSASLQVVVLPNQLDISITLDDYPGETSWALTNDLNGQDVFSSGSFAGLETGSTITDRLCLPQGCYTFTMNDSYGDGMCCDNGNGSYTVSNPQLGTIAMGGSFAYGESTSFCVDLSTQLAELGANTSLDVRPIDSEGRFLLDLPGVPGPLAFTVVDATGRAVIQRNTSMAGPELLDLRAWDTGVYLVELRSAHNSWTARMVRY